MPYFVISPLEGAPADIARIESLRRAHDPRHGDVGAHVTLVFGFDRPPVAVAIEHVRSVAAGFAPFACRLSSARAVRDIGGDGSHIFLTPDTGAAEIVALHDALYGGPLAAELRADIPFVPHVTVGHLADHAAAEALAARLAGAVDVVASLQRLDVVASEGGPVTTVASVPLGG